MMSRGQQPLFPFSAGFLAFRIFYIRKHSALVYSENNYFRTCS